MMYHVSTNFSTAAGCCHLDMSLHLPLNDVSSHVLSWLTRCDPDTMHMGSVICPSFPNLSRSSTVNDLSSHVVSQLTRCDPDTTHTRPVTAVNFSQSGTALTHSVLDSVNSLVFLASESTLFYSGWIHFIKNWVNSVFFVSSEFTLTLIRLTSINLLWCMEKLWE